MAECGLGVEVLRELELRIAEVILAHKILECGIFAEQVDHPATFGTEIEYHFDGVLIAAPLNCTTRLAC